MSVGGLRHYLSELTPQARALLLGEFERRVAAGDAEAESSVILHELRGLAPAPQLDELALLFFRPIEPLLIDDRAERRHPGRLSRAVLPVLWQWIADELIPEAVESYLAQAANALDEGEIGTAEALARALQDRCVAGLRSAFAAADEDGGRMLADSIGGRFPLDTIATLRWGLRGRDMLARLADALPGRMDDLMPDEAEQAFMLVESAARPREILPLALAILMDRLSEPSQLLRLAAYAAGSHSASRIAESEYGMTVDMLVCALERQADALEDVVQTGDFARAAVLLREIDADLRGFRAEMLIPAASSLARQLAAISERAATCGRTALGARGRRHA